MNLLQAYEEKNAILRKQEALYAKQEENIDKLIAAIKDEPKHSNNVLVNTQNEKVSQVLPKSRVGQIASKDLAALITTIFQEKERMTLKELERYLEDNYGFRWKNFNDTIRNLRKQELLFLEKEILNGITYHSLQ